MLRRTNDAKLTLCSRIACQVEAPPGCSILHTDIPDTGTRPPSSGRRSQSKIPGRHRDRSTRTATLQGSPLLLPTSATMSALLRMQYRMSPEASKRPSMHLAWPGSSEADNRLVHIAGGLENGGIGRRHLIADM